MLGEITSDSINPVQVVYNGKQAHVHIALGSPTNGADILPCCKLHILHRRKAEQYLRKHSIKVQSIKV